MKTWGLEMMGVPSMLQMLTKDRFLYRGQGRDPGHISEFLVCPQTAIDDTLVQDICYSPDTQMLLVRLSDTYDR